MQSKDKGKFNHCFYYSVFLSRVISIILSGSNTHKLEIVMMEFPGNKLMWGHWDITVLVWWRNVPFTNTPPWYWCIFWLPSSVTCKMCTMLWPVFFWPLPDWSGEPYFMLVTPDRGPAAPSHAGRAPTDIQTGMYKLGLLDLSLT